MPALTIATTSQLSSREMLGKINAVARTVLPDYFRSALQARGSALEVPSTLRIPPGARAPAAWVMSCFDAFTSDQWHFTTAEVRTIGNGQRLFPDYERGDEGVGPITSIDSLGQTVTENRPMMDLAIDGQVYAMTIPHENMCVNTGNTCRPVDPSFMPAAPGGGSTRGDRGLVVVANRTRVGAASRPMADADIVRALLHELACHAGLLSQNRPWLHGTPPQISTSDRYEHTIRQAFGLEPPDIPNVNPWGPAVPTPARPAPAPARRRMP